MALSSNDIKISNCSYTQCVGFAEIIFIPVKTPWNQKQARLQIEREKLKGPAWNNGAIKKEKNLLLRQSKN